MADEKVTELGAAFVVSPDDLLLIVDDPNGVPVNKKISGVGFLDSFITGSFGFLAGDVNFGTDYIDGPSLSLFSGTWLVMAHAMFQGRNTTNAMGVNMRISDGTNHYAIVRTIIGQDQQGSLACSAILVLSGVVIIKIQAGNGGVAENSKMLYRDPVNNIEKASQICAVKIR